MPERASKPASKGRLLVADDQAGIRRLLRRILEDEGYEVVEAKDGLQARELVEKNRFHLVLTDLKMPRLDGMDLLKIIKKESPETEVLVLTAYGTVSSAVEAMRHGAFDYLSKPLSEPDEVRVIVAKAMEHRRLSDENAALKAEEKWELIYEDERMAAVADTVKRIAPSDVTVLITGESGTGKEVVARLIHANSDRASRPFMAVNCAALPENLLESELFGYEKGAFTGADSRHRGRFEVAEGGTLFLDEIAEMSPGLQAKLLRVMQDRTFERLGGTVTITADVRLVAATNRDLPQEIRAGRFREDLFYRLNVVPIVLPPLRNRGRDSLVLARYYLEKISRERGRETPSLSESAERTMVEYPWPGNVRELFNVVERAVLLSPGPQIDEKALALDASAGLVARQSVLNLKELERDAIERALERAGGNRSQAAQILGIGLRTLHYKLNEYGLRKK